MAEQNKGPSSAANHADRKPNVIDELIDLAETYAGAVTNLGAKPAPKPDHSLSGLLTSIATAEGIYNIDVEPAREAPAGGRTKSIALSAAGIETDAVKLHVFDQPSNEQGTHSVEVRDDNGQRGYLHLREVVRDAQIRKEAPLRLSLGTDGYAEATLTVENGKNKVPKIFSYDDAGYEDNTRAAFKSDGTRHEAKVQTAMTQQKVENTETAAKHAIDREEALRNTQNENVQRIAHGQKQMIAQGAQVHFAPPAAPGESNMVVPRPVAGGRTANTAEDIDRIHAPEYVAAPKEKPLASLAQLDKNAHKETNAALAKSLQPDTNIPVEVGKTVKIIDSNAQPPLRKAEPEASKALEKFFKDNQHTYNDRAARANNNIQSAQEGHQYALGDVEHLEVKDQVSAAKRGANQESFNAERANAMLANYKKDYENAIAAGEDKEVAANRIADEILRGDGLLVTAKGYQDLKKHTVSGREYIAERQINASHQTEVAATHAAREHFAEGKVERAQREMMKAMVHHQRAEAYQAALDNGKFKKPEGMRELAWREHQGAPPASPASAPTVLTAVGREGAKNIPS